MKFKEGDRVTVSDISDYPKVFPLGKTFTIIHVNMFDDEIVYEKHDGTYILTKHLEFAHIYNSPLYKALK